MKQLSFIFFVLVGLSVGALAKPSLTLTKGTREFGGSIQLPIIVPKDGATIVGLHIAPSFGYFISDSFAINLSLQVSRQSITGENMPWSFGLLGGGAYYFDLAAWVYPYLGLKGGLEWQTTPKQTSSKSMNFKIETPVGVLVALNSRVALDIGIPITFTFNSDGFKNLFLPVGYLGVRAFF